ncbi:MAG TPA: DNA polymerase I [Anaerolineae bacterium]|nr:DNA polymerase I [Anaerolineae bacterium]
MARQKLILIDGHSLAYRAFYALPLYDQRGKPSFTTSTGEHTNAVYGFANMLIKTWAEEQPDGIAVAFDLGRTFRDDKYADYKATRMKMPDELETQVERIVQLVEAFDIPAVTADGYEADDILGTLAKRAGADKLDVLIITGDTDAFQLIDKRIRVLTSGRIWSDTHIYDEAAIKARYGLKPIQLIDFKALKGDTSDNIPGVRGIGEKTALTLLQKYGLVENIYKHLDQIEPARARTALEAGRDMAFLSKDLVTIRTEIPIKLDWAACAVAAYDRDKVEALFDQLEFRLIRNRLPQGGVSSGNRKAADQPVDTGVPAAGQQMSMFGAAASEVETVKPKKPSVTETIIVQDETSLKSLISNLQKAKIISFDTEATSTDPLRAALVGIALAVKEGQGYYIPIGHQPPDQPATQPPNHLTSQLSLATVVKALKPILENKNLPKVAHNAKYDMALLHQVGLDVRGLVFDTMLAEFLIDPSARLGLKALAKSRLGIEMTEITELIGTGKKQITMDCVPIEDCAPYAAADVDMTLRLMRVQEPDLARLGLRKLFDEVEMPLVPVLLDMELAGVLIDLRFFKKMSDRLAKRLAELEREVYEMVGMPLNLNSPNQLADALFGKLQLKAPGGRKTNTGKVSVAADVLESMRGLHPSIELILEHRQLSKLKGTYLDALPALVNPATGRVHTSFNQTGAVSGRIASQDPNLQNIPIRTELGREVRQGFIVAPGCKMISADYSQVELRIVAHICNDPGLRAAFKAGEDIHRATAAQVLGLPPEKVTADQRSFAKKVNFGLLYGMGTQSLAQQAGISMKEAQQFVDAYFAGFPSVKQYIDETKRRAKELGYVETLLGRRRYFPILKTETRDARTNIMQRAAEREAINHPVQGSAADILKIAMIRIHAELKRKKYQARLLLQVHDELVLEAPTAEVKAVSQLVQEIMESAYRLDPPLKVEVGVGENWDEVK